MTTGDIALLAAAAAAAFVGAVAAGMLPRVALVMPVGAAFTPGATPPAAPNPPCEGPVTVLDPQPTAANRAATMNVLERTTGIFQPLGLMLCPTPDC
jgi:hypothetical protein